MTELYWITRLNAINSLLIALLLLSLLTLVISFITWASDDFEDKILKKTVLISSILSFIFSLGIVFIPNTKEMLMIYGIGGSYEWVKENDTVKKLPNKCTQAIDKLLDEYLDKEENNDK